MSLRDTKMRLLMAVMAMLALPLMLTAPAGAAARGSFAPSRDLTHQPDL